MEREKTCAAFEDKEVIGDNEAAADGEANFESSSKRKMQQLKTLGTLKIHKWHHKKSVI